MHSEGLYTQGNVINKLFFATCGQFTKPSFRITDLVLLFIIQIIFFVNENGKQLNEHD